MQKQAALNKVRRKTSALSDLAMSFVLPHENPPRRLPVIPATLTATLSLMQDKTVSVGDSTFTRGFLCRDPCYPLWYDRTISQASCYLTSDSSGNWTIPNRTDAQIPLPEWDYISAESNSGTIDGASANLNDLADLTPLARAPDTGTTAIYVPYGSKLIMSVLSTVAGSGTGIRAELGWWSKGEPKVSTIQMQVTGTTGWGFGGQAGTSSVGIGSIIEGIVPYGFVWVKNWCTYGTAPTTATTTATLRLGWSTSDSSSGPTGQFKSLFPFSFPAEFVNSRTPYERTRLNSSAALFTNVSAVLSKEGTVLAARLRNASVDPWTFGIVDLNSTHPSLRYYGPLEKGLYTFTTPSGNEGKFSDNVIDIGAPVGNSSPTSRPLFNFMDIGLYNAFVFSDLGSASGATNLAASCYVHLEFETNSSLFTPGVSLLTLEHLHAAEVALLRFGHFHENPLHWAAIKTAALSALRAVGPMIAPVVRHYATKAVDAGVAMIAGRKAGGDRKMPQELAPRPAQMRTARKNKKAKAKSRRR